MPTRAEFSYAVALLPGWRVYSDSDVITYECC